MQKHVLLLVLILCGTAPVLTWAASPPTGPKPWNLEALSAPPQTFPAPPAKTEGITGLYFQGQPWKGKATRVFAYYGAPKPAPGERVPGVVLLHGGGGRAFEEWVKIWNRHGYAAIAVSLEGQAATDLRQGPFPRHDFSGPARVGTFGDIDEPVEDQWFYHAIADAILAHSLLRSFPEVDPDRIGATGISWGGVHTSVMAGVDTRLKFAIPVYGCGHLNESPIGGRVMAAAGATDKYLALWEPTIYLRRATAPLLFVNGSNDHHTPLNLHSKVTRVPTAPVTVCIRVGMRHGHQPGWEAKEIYAFADGIVKGGEPLATLTPTPRNGSTVTIGSSRGSITQANLVYTTDPGNWVECKWDQAAATVDAAGRTAHIELPAGTKAYFINVTDDRDLMVSSILEIVP